MTGSSSEIKLIPYDEAYEEGFEDMMRRVPDISKINKLIGYKPKITLDEILADVIQYQRAKVQGPQGATPTRAFWS
jgi:UDP-glucose 4-epimerase